MVKACPDGTSYLIQKDDIFSSLQHLSDGYSGPLTRLNEFFATPSLKRREGRIKGDNDFQAVNGHQEWEVPDPEGVMGQSIMVDGPTTIMLKGNESK